MAKTDEDEETAMSSSSTPPMSTLETAFNAAKRALSFTPLKLGEIVRDRDASAHPLPDDDPTVAVVRLSGIVEGEVLIAIGEEYLERLEYTSKTEGLLAAVQGTVDAIKTALHPLGAFTVDSITEATPADWPGAADVPITSASLTDHDEVVVRVAFGLAYHAVQEGTAREDDTQRIALPGAGSLAGATAPSPVSSPSTPTDEPGRLDAETAHEIALLADVQVEVSAVLGRAVVPMHELLSWLPGSIITLDRLAGTPAELCVGETVVATGDVVVVEENFGVRVTDVAMTGPGAPSVAVSRP